MNQTLEQFVGNTPLVRLQRVPGATSNVILAKLEGNNPAGSVKDRPALSMIKRAQARGQIKPGDTLIEPTSGNTGIALAMCAAMMGYEMNRGMVVDLLKPNALKWLRWAAVVRRSYTLSATARPYAVYYRSSSTGCPVPVRM